MRRPALLIVLRVPAYDLDEIAAHAASAISNAVRAATPATNSGD
jgi:hypothetical protein